jgi:hypothetical protein
LIVFGCLGLLLGKFGSSLFGFGCFGCWEGLVFELGLYEKRKR